MPATRADTKNLSNRHVSTTRARTKNRNPDEDRRTGCAESPQLTLRLGNALGRTIGEPTQTNAPVRLPRAGRFALLVANDESRDCVYAQNGLAPWIRGRRMGWRLILTRSRVGGSGSRIVRVRHVKFHRNSSMSLLSVRTGVGRPPSKRVWARSDPLWRFAWPSLHEGPCAARACSCCVGPGVGSRLQACRSCRRCLA